MGHTIKVHSGQGTPQTDPNQQLTVYLGSPTPVWDNMRDRAVILDPYGTVMDAREHERKTPERR